MTWTDPTRYVDGDFIRAPVWNTDVINNQQELHAAIGFRASASALLPQPRPAGEEQTVESDAGTATAGTWRLNYNGNWTQPMSFNVSAAELLNYLTLPGLYHVRGPNEGVVHDITVTGASLNAGFNIVFDSSRVPSPVEFTADDSLLVGDTITVTTITPSDSFALIPVQQAAVPPDFHSGQVSAGGLLPAGVWWFHGAVYWSSATADRPRAAIRVNNVAVAITRAMRPAGAGQFAQADVFWTGEIAEDSVVNLYAEADSGSSFVLSPAFNWFEGWYRGESAS